MLDALVRLGLLSAIFASAFLLSQIVLSGAWRRRAQLGAINLRLRMIRDGSSREAVSARLRKNVPKLHLGLPAPLAGPVRAVERMLMASAIPLRPLQIIIGAAGIFFILFLVILLAARSAGFPFSVGTLQIAGVMAFAVALGIPLLVINIIAQRRRKRIQEQFPVALDVFVRALRSGHPIAAAIDLLTKEMEDPIGSEFGLVSDEVAYGAQLSDALGDMAERWDMDDIRMFVVCLSVQTETGGNLAEILQNLSDVIRARASLYLKVRALSSEGRMTGWMLTVLPVLTLVGMFLVNPAFYLDVAQDRAFIFGFSALLILYAIGFITIRKMVDLKV